MVQISPDSESQNITHCQSWANGVWTVIMSRPMSAASANQVTFNSGMKSSIAFMNVDGSDFERDGHKTISQWCSLNVQ